MLVRIGDVPAGRLVREEGEAWSFRLLASYRNLTPRPVLGQVFEENLQQVWRSRTRLPPFFSNLLPEGPLRKLLAAETGVHPDREGHLLLQVGTDLPGAISVEREEEEQMLGSNSSSDAPPAHGSHPGDDEEAPIKYSLAGVQLKLSAVGDERGLTVPASGQGGNWIVKLPLPRHEELPRVEHSLLTWAERAGFDVPEHRLVRVEEIAGLPSDWPVRQGEALAVRRFDRPDQGVKVHQEDFAQVLDFYPDYAGKYRRSNHEMIGRLIASLVGPDGFDEYVRRLVFMVLSGNGDAHVKNWSLVYPDGYSAQLSPLYDQVFTRAFLPEDQLALRLGGERDFYRITSETFVSFARKVGVAPQRVEKTVSRSAEQIRSAWADHRADFPLPTEVRRQMDDHLSKIQI